MSTVYSSDNWKKGAKYYLMFKQTLIRIKTTEKATMNVIMVPRPNKRTSYSSTLPVLEINSNLVCGYAHKHTGSVM